MKKAVLFDFDGVLVNSFIYHFVAWRHVLQPLGIGFSPRQIFLNEGQPVREIAKNLVKNSNRALSEADIEDIITRKNDYFQRQNMARMMEGVREFIDFLKARAIKIGLVTGTVQKNIEAVLKPEEIALFDVIIKEGDTEHGKPAGDPYLAAAAKLGLPPSDCLVVENAPMGIAAAKAAGMVCVGLTTTLEAPILKSADFIFANMNELKRNFDRIV